MVILPASKIMLAFFFNGLCQNIFYQTNMLKREFI